MTALLVIIVLLLKAQYEEDGLKPLYWQVALCTLSESFEETRCKWIIRSVCDLLIWTKAGKILCIVTLVKVLFISIENPHQSNLHCSSFIARCKTFNPSNPLAPKENPPL
jgi:hypothetical protein